VSELKQGGEKWFKGMRMPSENWDEYFLQDHHNPEWSKGIPRVWNKGKWNEALEVVQKFITYDG
jgi:hypothetical protein